MEVSDAAKYSLIYRMPSTHSHTRKHYPILYISGAEVERPYLKYNSFKNNPNVVKNFFSRNFSVGLYNTEKIHIFSIMKSSFQLITLLEIQKFRI